MTKDTRCTYAALAQRAEFAARQHRPVVVMPDEVEWLAGNMSVAIPAAEALHPWTWEQATKEMLRQIERGTARLFGQRVVLGPLTHDKTRLTR